MTDIPQFDNLDPGPWTDKRVRETLGLKPADTMYLDAVTHALDHREKWGEEGCAQFIRMGRASGRTWNTLVKAVVHVANGGWATIHARTQELERFGVDQAHEWLRRMGEPEAVTRLVADSTACAAVRRQAEDFVDPGWGSGE